MVPNRPMEPPSASPVDRDDASAPRVQSGQAIGLGGAWRANRWAILTLLAATLAIELGVWLLTGGFTGDPWAVVAALAASTVWIALAAPAAAAGPEDAWSALLRGGTVIDASGLALLVLWALARMADGPLLPLSAVVRIYAIWLATGLAGVAAARCARTPTGRCAGAVAAAAVLMAAAATPFWTGGLLTALDGDARAQAAALAVNVNPICAAASSAETLQFTWQEAPRMYRITAWGDYVPVPRAHWYAAAVIWGAVAGILAATHLLPRPRSDPA